MPAAPTSSPTIRPEIEMWLADFQLRLCQQLEAADSGAVHFLTDTWQREGGGGGRSKVLEKGHILEKGGVGFSAVWGQMSEAAARQLHMPDPSFYATGVSVVLHPRSPQVPIIHMNVRYFEAGNGESWFGGGIDLTPIYVNEAQARRFHARLREVCDRHNPAYYPKFTRWADDYFFLPHRQETRGVGGIFFDRLTVGPDGSAEALFQFVQDVAELFGPFYTEIMAENHALPFGEREEAWQSLRRARYAEFNLAFDRGTRFGLETGGRTESILMSLPPRTGWAYNPAPPAPGSPEATTLAWLRKGVDWLANA
ncbi:oxygen-dependent coproporphyrinogen oxidase [Hymenobacter sp. BT683]|uniref:coproporphyrinogen oxidase n=1 Tax=Hymenobacter jeongseonensis TaxID=2791027 RepID=A0ABS0IKN8_9BACT|nr:oxygen-dependent coproporphyrinogen oxidase [Hymenobacter jeongseonensis]MBF9238903.1 oxygen-dependent coproporphyrinogen oxidase [Hymenobacter jeongseonensis]